jgi:hypothetical protein
MEPNTNNTDPLPTPTSTPLPINTPPAQLIDPTPSQSVISSEQPRQQKNNTHKTLISVLIILVVVLIAVGGWYVYKNYHKTTNTPTSTTTPTTNTWVGKGNNTNWDSASNWSLGVPQNGQNLDIDLSNIKTTKDSDGNVITSINNNINGLVINELIFNGSSKFIDVKGNGLTIKNQILNEGASPEIDNNLDLDGNIIITNTQAGTLVISGVVTIPKSSIVNMKTGCVDSSNNPTPLPLSTIQFNNSLSGSGPIYISDNSCVQFAITSPNLDSQVTIGSGAIVDLANNILGVENGATLGTPDGLGNSEIDIQNGGSLDIDSMGSIEGNNQTLAMTITNNITMSGNGLAYDLTNTTGDITGAITSCISGPMDCVGNLPGQGTPAVVTFTGTVTLAGNTELGAVTIPPFGSDPTQYSYTNYIFKNALVNPSSYTLTAVLNSKVQITQ